MPGADVWTGADGTRGRRAFARSRDDSGAGSVLAIGLVSAVVLASGGVALLAGALVLRHGAAGAADAAALAAADVAVGIHPGYPCEVAAAVADANGAALASCEIDELVVTVTVFGPAAFGPGVTARATAGPPGEAHRAD